MEDGSDCVNTYPDAREPKPISLEVRIASTALLIAGLVALAYIGWFVQLPIGGPADWGVFGDFFGGIVNPVVGLATVLLVVRTLQVTRAEMAAQLKHFTDEAALTDLNRRLEGTFKEWNRVAESQVFQGSLGMSESGEVFRVRDKTLMEVVNSDRSLGVVSNRFDTRGYVDMSHRRNQQFRQLRALTLELSAYCSEYETKAGNRRLADYYRRRVWRAVTFMAQAEIISMGQKEALRPAEL